MIGKKFNLEATGVVPMIMVRGTDKESYDEFEGHMTLITDKMGEIIKENIDAQHLMERLNNMESIKQIENMDFALIPKAIFATGVDYVNAQAKLSDPERMLIMMEALNQCIKGAHDWWGEQCRQRMERIGMKPPSKIVGMNGRPPGKPIIHNN